MFSSKKHLCSKKKGNEYEIKLHVTSNRISIEFPFEQLLYC